MDKKYLFLFIGVIIFFGLFVAFIALQLNQNQKSPVQQSQTQNSVNSAQTAQIQNGTSVSQTNQKRTLVPTVTFAPLSSSPKEAARQFYMYYFATSQNPLAHGQYKNNPYLSDDFKELLASGYNNGNAPVFCLQNKRTNIIVGKEVQIYWNNQYLRQETISEASSVATTSAQDLYNITLENNNGKWLIFDVNCVY